MLSMELVRDLVKALEEELTPVGFMPSDQEEKEEVSLDGDVWTIGHRTDLY